jgi:glycosyltransferase involved in cell wall biosynthesis
MPLGRYFLCDQSIIGLHGHCYTYMASVAAETRRRGYPTSIIGNRQIALGLRHAVEPTFTFMGGSSAIATEAGAEGDLDGYLHQRHTQQLNCDLVDLDQQYNFVPSDRLVFNLVHHWSITGIVSWLESLSASRRPLVGLILHATGSPKPDGIGRPSQSYVDALRCIVESPCGIRIFCDTEQLAAEYAAAGIGRVTVLPIPHSQNAPLEQGNLVINKRIQIGFVGEARFHKGFHLLPFLVRDLLHSQSPIAVDFRIHCFTTDEEADYYRKSIAHLRAFPNVSLHPAPLDEKEYWRFIDCCDLLLLPYTREYYHSQSSGILSDAIARMCPVVVTAGTWMSAVVGKYGNGEICLPDDYLSLAIAVRRACINLPEIRSAARAAQSNWIAFHNPTRFVDVLDETFDMTSA